MNASTYATRFRASLFASLATLATFLTAAFGQAVTISDPNVELAIRESINKPTGDLTAADLAKVTELDLSGETQDARGEERLTTLKMPEGLVNLEVLNVRNNNLNPSLFAPVSIPPDMVNLTDVDFSGNFRLSNVSFLNSLDLSKLIRLDLSATALGKLTLNADMPILQTLQLRTAGLTELILPDGMSELTTLELQFNDLETFVAPAGMSKLEELNLGDQELATVVLHPTMEALEVLHLNNNPLESVELPENLRNLREINAYDDFFEEDRVSKLKNFVVPKGYVNLVRLDLDYNGDLENLTLSEGLHEEADPNEDFILRLQGTDNLKTLTVDEPLLDDQRLVFQIFDVLEERGVEIVVTIPPTVLSTPVVLESGDLEFTLTGPIRPGGEEGFYIVYESTDLTTWAEVDRVENVEGSVTITVTPTIVPTTQKPPPAAFYRTERIDPERGEPDDEA